MARTRETARKDAAMRKLAELRQAAAAARHQESSRKRKNTKDEFIHPPMKKPKLNKNEISASLKMEVDEKPASDATAFQDELAGIFDSQVLYRICLY